MNIKMGCGNINAYHQESNIVEKDDILHKSYPNFVVWIDTSGGKMKETYSRKSSKRNTTKCLKK